MSAGVLVVVEGDTDEPFAERLVTAAGLPVDRTIVMHGHGNLDNRVARWCQPSNRRRMLILRDFDPSLGTPCAAALVTHLVGSEPHSTATVFRVAERALESWLLADREGVACYFHVPIRAIPTSPDRELDPKRTLVNLCRRSSSSRIRRGMIPDARGRRQVGPEFTGLVLGFGSTAWDVERARLASPSLDRAVLSLGRLAEQDLDGYSP